MTGHTKEPSYNTITTPNHINNLHNITNPPNLSAILYEDFILLKKIKKSKSKRKGRIYKIIQSKIETQDKIAKDIIVILHISSKLNNCNHRYIHTYLYLLILIMRLTLK